MEILSSPRRGRRGNLSGFGTNKLGTLIFGSKVELGFRGQILLQFGEDLVKEATVLGKIHRGIISKVNLLNSKCLFVLGHIYFFLLKTRVCILVPFC